ncbi:hypothetical protein CHLRE_06g278215v5 [Chlamydomonas reinhardtii]|uniref:3-hydroxyisobutyryl-CoA hydrolase n=1 Tax=Chlamydomonas reinhardtii TaxID=3055 RepID=A8J8Y6_CHLRE|nr:uncharacterized protein CHLRE_06g278215v5 [Chlamydomonas reinhardtii]PNW82326.1 hypothetical protein CHLRE_06g278215v5 [Chlamydomonas reinhardtii]|eukprot:XP_001697990.1 predicted protein [Chlamydomonas reinhardtii]
MSTAAAQEPEVLVDMKGSVAVVTLNRPKALNSLSLGMVQQLLALNTQITAQPRPGEPVSCVVVKGAGGKAFCAGGDVKELVVRALARNAAGASASGPDPAAFGVAFFRTEYANNAAISQLPVPYVALIDGICMGGGVGASFHGAFRVATERTILAMPEAGIGLFPDIGASFFLHRLPGCLGRYMGLTGERLTGAEVKDAGFATHLVRSARIPELEAALVALGPRAADLSVVDNLIRSFEEPLVMAGAGAAGSLSSSALLEWKLPLINVHFGCGGVEEVIASLEGAVAAAEAAVQQPAAGSLEAAQAAFLKSTLAAMRRGSPLSHAMTWEMLRRSAAGHMTLRQALEMEFVMAARCVHGQADFLEGVRALLIDKDNKPAWKYGSVRQIPGEVVAALFEPLPGEGPLFGGSGSGSGSGPASRM